MFNSYYTADGLNYESWNHQKVYFGRDNGVVSAATKLDSFNPSFGRISGGFRSSGETPLALATKGSVRVRVRQHCPENVLLDFMSIYHQNSMKEEISNSYHLLSAKMKLEERC